MKATDQPAAQPTPTAHLRAMAEHIARAADPRTPFTDADRITAACAATENAQPGAVHDLLAAAPPVTTPTTHGVYVGQLQQIAGGQQ